ncbi:NAD(P)H-dependent FMN reductase [Roseiarcus fermentans]|uniref:NAD(P)H-dependent FMN reductase n=1 Tax=Roseiarcus fermentans TaxID=1473586 RepID=A0A366EVJ2_9HYPH|nr:NADPH-dependent FMN reductase [Roseiarcus fermentans]RBP06398.1 NAD(P)H-dependent FMN reductase [Roseiarcus fermentans]
MRVLAISGSLRQGSSNTAALEALARLAPDGMRVLVYHDIARLPPYNPDDDVEDQPKPELVVTFRAIVGACDAIVIATPEYAHGVPGMFKNALDWLVASETFAGKRVVLINTSPRAFHAQANLREILATMAARLLADAFITLPLTSKTITCEEIVADPTCSRRLGHVLDALREAVQES